MLQTKLQLESDLLLRNMTMPQHPAESAACLKHLPASHQESTAANMYVLLSVPSSSWHVHALCNIKHHVVCTHQICTAQHYCCQPLVGAV
jgi:hypothetical protein